ncbi:MAG TPA: right-handed parallel beta-helix repeat-containing protein [Armatimonadaceae bacterium]|nr:right-handed parallel beta-helix repeat-containing protein [Armatimonadaceae bacterium]
MQDTMEDGGAPTRREWLRGGAVAAAAGLTAAAVAGLPPAAVAAPPTPGAAFDVRAFGAKGYGKADDAAAAQAAADAALKSGGGWVHFPAGTYRMGRGLRFAAQERVDVTGDGLSTTLLHERDEPLLLWPEGVSCREVSVRHLRVVSTGEPKAQGTAVVHCAGGVERSYFQHLLFFADSVRMGSGIVTEGVADTTTLESCVFWGVGGTGLKVARGSEVRVFGGRVIGNGSLSPGNVGIHVTGNNGGVHVVTTDLIGLHTSMQVGGGPGVTSNREVFLTHATFDGSVHGLVQTDHAYTSVAGCWAASCDEEQILLAETAGGAILSVSGGTIFNGGAHGRTGAHHGLVVRAGRFTLTGVQVRHNKGVGVLVGDGAGDYAITGCRIHDNGTGAELRGDRFAVSGCVFTNNGTNLTGVAAGPNRQITGNVL